METQIEIIDQKLFSLTRLVAVNTSRIMELVEQDSPRSLERASDLGCRTLEKLLLDPLIEEVLTRVYKHNKEDLLEARSAMEGKNNFNEFFEVEFALLRLVGVSKPVAEMIIEECRRLGLAGLESSPSPNKLISALKLLEAEVCECNRRQKDGLRSRRVQRKLGGWTLLLANGSVGALSSLGVPFSFGASLTLAAGAAASSAYGGALAFDD